MSFSILIIILIICILLEGFFSGSEMAVVNAQKFKIAIETNKGSRMALAALHLVKHPALFFATTLIGTNICTVTASVVMTFYLISNYGVSYAPFAIIIWPFNLILGEMVPKSIYQYYADKLIFKVSPVLLFLSWVLYPIVWPISKFTDFLLGGVKKKLGQEAPLTREDLELLMEEHTDDQSDVKSAERNMISSILDLADKKVENIMTPLIDVISISINATRADAELMMEEYAFSRIPVYEGRSFNIVGVITGTDLLFGDKNFSLKQLIQPVYFVPENMPLDNLLINMKRKGTPLAIAVDEFGAATGVVTSEDLLEEVVGEIRDEHDVVSTLYQRVAHNRYVVNARMEIEEANEKLKLNIPEGEYATIAGYLIENTERIPKIGETVKLGEYVYTIKRATKKAILEIEIAKNSNND